MARFPVVRSVPTMLVARQALPPVVSILMPALNAEAFLSQAIESVLAQTSSISWELLIVDDGSQDSTATIARSYARRFARCIRFLQHPANRNHGTSASRNLAMRHAQGHVLAMLDADDVWLPHMLEEQMELLHMFPEAGMVYANAERAWDLSLPYDPQLGSLGYNTVPPLLPAKARPGLLPPPHPLDWFLNDETLVPCTCTVLVRTAAARAVGGFVDRFQGLYDDQAFYAKLMLRYPAAVSTRCVARYRRHHGSCCVRAWEDEPLQQAARRQFETWLEEYRVSLQTPSIPTDLVAQA